MRNNYFTIGKKIYRQNTRTETGTAVAPEFSNLYLWLKFHPDFRKNKSKEVMHLQYIDDGFVILQDKDSDSALIRDLNAFSNLELEGSISEQSAVYQDV